MEDLSGLGTVPPGKIGLFWFVEALDHNLMPRYVNRTEIKESELIILQDLPFMLPSP